MTFLFVFFPVILIGYYGLLQKMEHRNVFLLLASLIFYSWGEPSYIVLMLISISINYRIGLMLDKEENLSLKKQYLGFGVFCNIFFLFLFKYEVFFTIHFNEIVGSRFPVRITSLNLALPIGISFFTFQAISYLVDVYRTQAPVQRSVLNLALYISFFPQLVAGPIVRYVTIAEQINERKTTYAQFTEGVKRFIIGIGKKIIFANTFSLIAIDSFGQETPSVAFAWLGAICYTLQIYYDFSGYSDMAIGLGKMFGFDFLENFNYPYISKTVTEFWRRWHISLGSWFRDYVYIPLGGSRVSKARLVVNLFVVWALTGIWHGAAWRFVAWGLFYFSLLTVEKLLNLDHRLRSSLFAIPYQMFTLLMVIFGWVIFGEDSLKWSLHHIKAMFGLNNGQVFVDNDFLRNVNNDGILLLLAIYMATPLFSKSLAQIQQQGRKLFQKNHKIYVIFREFTGSFVYLFVFFVSVSYLVMGAHNPFIYFNF